MLKCLHCGFSCKGLTLHLKYKHSQTPAEYRVLFPGSEIFCKSTKIQMSKNSHVAKFIDCTLEERLGTEAAAKARINMSAAAGQHLIGKKRTEEYKNKMREVWNEKRESWTASIRKSAARPEIKKKQSESMKARIASNGYHLAKGKESKFEASIRNILESNGYTVILQKATKKASLGVTRFFDILIPSLNLLIECDGEWWHRTADRITIDTEKTNAAYKENYKLLRISDSEFSRNFNDPADAKLLLSLLPLGKEALFDRSINMINSRRIKLDSCI